MGHKALAHLHPVLAVLTVAVLILACGGETTPAQPDLVVVDLTFDPNTVIPQREFTATCLVRNDGDLYAGPFTIRLHFDSRAGLEDCTLDIVGLMVGQTAWEYCTRTTTIGGSFPVEATVDAENVITESDEGNNVLKTTLTVGN